ncbi:sigma factor [Streptomyces lydicus]|uniref:sigma factor n=1 Tax=Streptomyces lydicus TaxID=47763 RepID=UPI00378CB636
MTNHAEPAHNRSDAGLSAIISERRQLTSLAYRLLGSLAEAEDAVQETYARWYAMPRQQRPRHRHPRRPPRPRRHPDRGRRRPGQRSAPPGRRRRTDRALRRRDRPQDTRQRDDPGAFGQRPARPGRAARGLHRGGGTHSRSPRTGSSTSGRYATPTSSGPGGRADSPQCAQTLPIFRSLRDMTPS